MVIAYYMYTHGRLGHCNQGITHVELYSLPSLMMHAMLANMQVHPYTNATLCKQLERFSFLSH